MVPYRCHNPGAHGVHAIAPRVQGACRSQSACGAQGADQQMELGRPKAVLLIAAESLSSTWCYMKPYKV